MPARLFGLSGGDFGIFQTISQMRSAVYRAMRAPAQAIRQKTETILHWVPERDETAELRAIFSYVQNHFHYVNDPYDIEYFKTPETIDEEIDRTGFFLGDCDDASTYLAALLKSAGYAPAFVTITPLDSSSFDYAHVFVGVYSPSLEQWIFMDPTAKGRPFGWAPPSKRIATYAV